MRRSMFDIWKSVGSSLDDSSLDPVNGVQRLRWLKECRRLRRNYSMERSLGAPVTFIAGVDETGRGPLAGPVVAAAVILPFGCLIPGLDDSKRLSRDARKVIFEWIMRRALAIGVAGASPGEIDDMGINPANFRAMRHALDRLIIAPGVALIDGNQLVPGLEMKQIPVTRGDSKSNSIAAASVVAKVVRDRIMLRHHCHYPEFSFDTNVGYPTAAHRRALEEYGPTPLHRHSFIRHYEFEQPNFFSDAR